MTAPRWPPPGYIHFLLASPRAARASEAARVQPARPQRPAHDACTRLRHRLEPEPEQPRIEVAPLVCPRRGSLAVDDSTLDKPYAGQSALVRQHWSGKRRAAVWGINRVSLVWTGGDRPYPAAYRPYDRAGDGKAKNDHARARSGRAKQRGFQPRCLSFDQR